MGTLILVLLYSYKIQRESNINVKNKVMETSKLTLISDMNN